MARDTTDRPAAPGSGPGSAPGIVHREAGPAHYWFDPRLLATIDAACFEPSHWRSRDALLGEATGRGAAYFLAAGDGQRWVLRHYRRGGLLARFNDDRYVWTGAARTRCAREFRMLATLWARGLPVPRPVAARAQRDGALGYRADLITVMIADTRPLADVLMTSALGRDDWARIGELIARMHATGVRHADLNARNLLRAADGRMHVIDFDRASHASPDRERWREANLARLRRSLDKFAAHAPVFHFAAADWARLRAGYRAAGRALGFL